MHTPLLAIINLLSKLPDFWVKFCRILSESQRLFCTACALGLLCSPGPLCCWKSYTLFLSTTFSLPVQLSKIFLIPKDFRVRRISEGKIAGKHTQSLSEPFKKELQQSINSCFYSWCAVLESHTSAASLSRDSWTLIQHSLPSSPPRAIV